MKHFDLRPQCRPTVQRRIMDLLRRSPLPWTADMLRTEGARPSQISTMTFTRRITRLTRGLYTGGHYDRR